MNYKNFIYNEERAIIFAYVPKVACTNWKSLLRYMAGQGDWLNSKLAHDKVLGGIRYLDLDSASDAALLKDPHICRYAMVRNPYSRVLSAYLNKIENRLPLQSGASDEDHFNKVVRDIEAFRSERLDSRDHQKITLKVFLYWLRDSGSWFCQDEHWVPQSRLLLSSSVKFDFLGRFENLKEDAGVILDYMRCDQGFPSQGDVKFQPNNADNKVSVYYDDECRDLVNDIYADDFLEFDYQKVLTSVKDDNNERRYPVKQDALKVISDIGVPITTVIDVGVLNGTRSLMDQFSDKHHLLVEPISEWASTIRKAYDAANIDYVLASVAATDYDGEANLKTTSVNEKAVTHARLTKDCAGDSIRVVPARRIDTLVSDYKSQAPFLLKIDVDGAELDVLRGAEATLGKTAIVIIEVQVRNFFERSEPLVLAGFELFDIVDICYYDGRLSQFDLVFANTKMIGKKKLEIFPNGFDQSKWQAYHPGR